MQGEEAARLFFGDGNFTRRRAMPVTALKLLQDRGSVQLLEAPPTGSAWTPWRTSPPKSGAEPPTAGNAAVRWRCCRVQDIFSRSACRLAGLELDEAAQAQRTREFVAMINGAGSVSLRNWLALRLRRRSERWAKSVIEQIRSRAQRDSVPPTPVEITARHEDENGTRLPPEAGAVGLLNLLRPTVAVAWFVVFGVKALHENPAVREKVAEGDEGYLMKFAAIFRCSP